MKTAEDTEELFMFEQAWMVTGSIMAVAQCVGAFEKRIEEERLEPNEVLEQLAEAEGIVRDIRASIHEVEAQRQQWIATHGAAAYVESPQVMFAPIKGWHAALDTSLNHIALLRSKYKRHIM